MEKREIAKTEWVTLFETDFENKKGKISKYYFLSRNQDRKVVNVICRSTRYNRFLFISQYRVPLDKKVIGFPAGLVDDGETPEQAALRELKEETGYNGKIVSVSKEMPKSAGLTTETTYLVECIVDEKAVGQTAMEDSEDIQHFWMTPRQFFEYSRTLDPSEYLVSANVGHYIAGFIRSRKKV